MCFPFYPFKGHPAGPGNDRAAGSPPVLPVASPGASLEAGARKTSPWLVCPGGVRAGSPPPSGDRVLFPFPGPVKTVARKMLKRRESRPGGHEAKELSHGAGRFRPAAWARGVQG